jgi:hypothetical protein
MTSAANNQAYGNPGWGTGSGDYRGRWGNFHGGAMPPWFPPHAAKPVLIVAMILGFVFWWPVGLALLALLMWNRHACGGFRRYGGWQGPGIGPSAGGNGPWQGGWQRWTGSGGGNQPSSGNRAFDEYRAETLRRLEDEQKEFGEFLDRLRVAKDKAEFDQFMNDRRDRPAEPPPQQPAQG